MLDVIIANQSANDEATLAFSKRERHVQLRRSKAVAEPEPEKKPEPAAA